MRLSALFLILFPALSFAQENYSINTDVAPKIPTIGAPARFTLSIEPKTPWALKSDTPFSIVLKSSTGIALEKTKFGNKDIDLKSKSVTTAFSVKAAGAQSISADLSFFLCSAEICQRYKDTVDVKFEAKK